MNLVSHLFLKTHGACILKNVKLPFQNGFLPVFAVYFKQKASNIDQTLLIWTVVDVCDEYDKPVEAIRRHVRPHGVFISTAGPRETECVMRMPFPDMTETFALGQIGTNLLEVVHVLVEGHRGSSTTLARSYDQLHNCGVLIRPQTEQISTGLDIWFLQNPATQLSVITFVNYHREFPFGLLPAPPRLEPLRHLFLSKSVAGWRNDLLSKVEG